MPTSPYLLFPLRTLDEVVAARADTLQARMATASIDELLAIIAELDALTDLIITPNANDNEGDHYVGA